MRYFYSKEQKVGVSFIMGPELYNYTANIIMDAYNQIWFNHYLECIVNVNKDTYEIEITRKSRNLLYTCFLTLLGFSFTRIYLSSNDDKLLNMTLDLLNNFDGVRSSSALLTPIYK